MGGGWTPGGPLLYLRQSSSSSSSSGAVPGMGLLNAREKMVLVVSDSTAFTASNALSRILAHYDGQIEVHENLCRDADLRHAEPGAVRAGDGLFPSLDSDDEEEEGEGAGFEPPEEARARARLPQVTVRTFTNIRDSRRLDCIAGLAAQKEALVVFTLVNPRLRSFFTLLLAQADVPCVDLIDPTIAALSTLYDAQPRRSPPGGAAERRREALGFALEQDDGLLVQNIHRADVILLGVSRVSKTPLSMYLGARYGYKVANVPLVLGMEPPPEILRVDPRRVFGLIIQPRKLHKIRAARAQEKSLESCECFGGYSSFEMARKEIAWCRRLYEEHPEWVVLDATYRGVEENAAIVSEVVCLRTTHAQECAYIVISAPHTLTLQPHTEKDGLG
eukprot:CAMPEP_0206240302 /NCGR_PEP_ID=MMETSP0047_2-20121206/15864_1 /ASSEMBLY_ACC=CAM_ASM_000192 /TAXON_ID=195065 /ORGANISM="Chroomonas mesostigmatica_cf, Strain CCMP1168" /LENGTH=389 /DNA_ID=CAMNT_0053665071 /DNA_START=282 /DNA_END=1447 /DNA_ORIENTATION=+